MPEMLDYHFQGSLRDSFKEKAARLYTLLGPRKTRGLMFTLLLAIMLPITLIAVRTSQELRQHAAIEGMYKIPTGIIDNRGNSITAGTDSASGIEYLQLGSMSKFVSLGVALDRGNFADPRVEQTLKNYGFIVLSMANSLKTFTVLYGVNSTNYTDTSKWNWYDADQMITIAKRNGWKVHGHTLVWHANNPTWINNLSDADLRSFLQLYVTTVMTRYCGKIDSMDVVNEVFQDNGSTLPSGIWTPGGDYNISIWNKAFSGNSYIKSAFQWARAACPSMKLFLNDYNGENKNSKSDGIFNYINTMKAQGVPIDGYGMQMHQGNISGQFEYGFVNPTSVADNMKRFSDIGVEVQISEYDQIVNDHTATTLQSQAQRAGEIAQACYSAPNCKNFIVWGLTDGGSSYKDISPQPLDGLGYSPLLFDTNFQPKANYWSVKNGLRIP